jgi:hypothetical protein
MRDLARMHNTVFDAFVLFKLEEHWQSDCLEGKKFDEEKRAHMQYKTEAHITYMKTHVPFYTNT